MQKWYREVKHRIYRVYMCYTTLSGHFTKCNLILIDLCIYISKTLFLLFCGIFLIVLSLTGARAWLLNAFHD